MIEAHKETNEVEVHTLYPRAVGPHPTGNFEVLFTRRAFASFVSWLMWHRHVSQQRHRTTHARHYSLSCGCVCACGALRACGAGPRMW